MSLKATITKLSHFRLGWLPSTHSATSNKLPVSLKLEGNCYVSDQSRKPKQKTKAENQNRKPKQKTKAEKQSRKIKTENSKQKPKQKNKNRKPKQKNKNRKGLKLKFGVSKRQP